MIKSSLCARELELPRGAVTKKDWDEPCWGERSASVWPPGDRLCLPQLSMKGPNKLTGTSGRQPWAHHVDVDGSGTWDLPRCPATRQASFSTRRRVQVNPECV